MTQHMTKKAASLAFAMAAFAWAGSAQAASDYLLKLEGIPGESKAKPDGHKGWIELESVQLGVSKTATGGVNVASGDVNAAPHDAASGQASGKRTHNPVRIRMATDEETAALLLPAVQKVREAAARMPAWEGCAAGQKIEGLAIKQKSTGRTGRILDATVSTCATEQVSFNFTKIEWD